MFRSPGAKNIKKALQGGYKTTTIIATIKHYPVSWMDKQAYEPSIDNLACDLKAFGTPLEQKVAKMAQVVRKILHIYIKKITRFYEFLYLIATKINKK